MSDPTPLRFGLAGTGYWARVAHAPALASTPGVRLAAIFGRNPAAARELADDFAATAYADVDAFLADVDAVAFAVPPDVQDQLAGRAAAAGRHLLLEKPVGLSASAADALADAVVAAGVASVVFFTLHFQPDTRAWLDQAATAGGWAGGTAIWLASAYSPASPFDTPWRREKGGLWDVGPHAVSLLWRLLGPVRHVTADAGEGDVTYLVLHHEGGPTSTATLTLGAPKAADSFGLQVWGEHGVRAMPALAADPVPALRAAATELAATIGSGATSHPLDVRFGRAITHVLDAAQRQLDDRRVSQGYAQ